MVTNKTDNPILGETQGIQDNVLQPGIYFLNPEEKRVDIISVGFNETTQMVKTRDGSGIGGTGHRLGATLAKDPEYVPDTGIEFPSNDGFPIHLDYTAIWGIMPDQAPDVVRQFGTLKDVEQKVILPQIGSICRLHGSKKGAVDLLVGDTREQFQTDTAEELSAVLTRKNLTLLFGLTRHIYVPNQVREPIQKARIAEELTKTREQEQLTAKAQADLSEAKAKVVQEQDRTKAETEKMIAQVTAEGEKKAREKCFTLGSLAAKALQVRHGIRLRMPCGGRHTPPCQCRPTTRLSCAASRSTSRGSCRRPRKRGAGPASAVRTGGPDWWSACWPARCTPSTGGATLSSSITTPHAAALSFLRKRKRRRNRLTRKR